MLEEERIGVDNMLCDSKIAILMGTYNGEKYIKEQIESIIRQDFKEWILYINDDGSSDDTIKIVEKYKNIFPDKIFLTHNLSSKHGATANFADLFEKVPSHQYYVFCDQDDVWEDNKLSLIKNKFDEIERTQGKQVPTLVYSKMNVVSYNLEVLAPSVEEFTKQLFLGEEHQMEKLLISNYVPGCAMAFNYSLKTLLNKYPDMIAFHDWWLILIAATFGRIFYINESLSNYRQHANNTIGIKKQMNLFFRILENLNIEIFKKHKSVLMLKKNQAVLQGELLLQIYSDKLKDEQKIIIKKYLKIMKSKLRLIRIIQGFRLYKFSSSFIENLIYWFFNLEGEK